MRRSAAVLTERTDFYDRELRAVPADIATLMENAPEREARGFLQLWRRISPNTQDIFLQALRNQLQEPSGFELAFYAELGRPTSEHITSQIPTVNELFTTLLHIEIYGDEYGATFFGVETQAFHQLTKESVLEKVLQIAEPYETKDGVEYRSKDALPGIIAYATRDFGSESASLENVLNALTIEEGRDCFTKIYSYATSRLIHLKLAHSKRDTDLIYIGHGCNATEAIPEFMGDSATFLSMITYRYGIFETLAAKIGEVVDDGGHLTGELSALWREVAAAFAANMPFTQHILTPAVVCAFVDWYRDVYDEVANIIAQTFDCDLQPTADITALQEKCAELLGRKPSVMRLFTKKNEQEHRSEQSNLHENPRIRQEKVAIQDGAEPRLCLFEMQPVAENTNQGQIADALWFHKKAAAKPIIALILENTIAELQTERVQMIPKFHAPDETWVLGAFDEIQADLIVDRMQTMHEMRPHFFIDSDYGVQGIVELRNDRDILSIASALGTDGNKVVYVLHPAGADPYDVTDDLFGAVKGYLDTSILAIHYCRDGVKFDVASIQQALLTPGSKAVFKAAQEHNSAGVFRISRDEDNHHLLEAPALTRRESDRLLIDTLRGELHHAVLRTLFHEPADLTHGQSEPILLNKVLEGISTQSDAHSFHQTSPVDCTAISFRNPDKFVRAQRIQGEVRLHFGLNNNGAYLKRGSVKLMNAASFGATSANVTHATTLAHFLAAKLGCTPADMTAVQRAQIIELLKEVQDCCTGAMNRYFALVDPDHKLDRSQFSPVIDFFVDEDPQKPGILKAYIIEMHTFGGGQQGAELVRKRAPLSDSWIYSELRRSQNGALAITLPKKKNTLKNE